MTSNDTTLDINSIALQLRELITINREQIADMKTLSAQMQKDNAEFRAQITKDFADFKDSVDGRLTGVYAEIAQINQRITGIEHDITGLYHWDYWLLTIIVAVVAMPQIISGIKTLFAALAEGIEGIVSIFRKGNK